MSSSAPLAFNSNDRRQTDVHKHVILDDIQVYSFIQCHSAYSIVHNDKGFLANKYHFLPEKCLAELCDANYVNYMSSNVDKTLVDQFFHSCRNSGWRSKT